MVHNIIWCGAYYDMVGQYSRLWHVLGGVEPTIEYMMCIYEWTCMYVMPDVYVCTTRICAGKACYGMV